MAKSYKRHHNAGPVPYPDQSGKYLHDEIVTGDEWEPFVALDYVVVVESGEGPAQTPAPKPAPEPKPAPVVAPVAAVESDPLPEQSAVSEEQSGDAREAQKSRRKKFTPSGENQ